MKIYPFNAIYPNIELIASSDSFFATVRDDFIEYFRNGFFEESDAPAFYIEEIRIGPKTHTGLIGCLDVAEYSKGRIVPHEQTIASSEQAMLKVLLQRGTMVKPVLVCHPAVPDIRTEIKKQKKKQKPFLQITTNNGQNQYTLYRIPETDAEVLVELYRKQVPKVYIADGHHRCSTAEKLMNLQGNKNGKEYSLIMAALFAFEELSILDYNRVVQLPHHFKPTRFIAEISRYCDLTHLPAAAKPRRKHDMTMCVQEEWYLLTWKPEILRKYKKMPAVLDAHMLNKEILEGVLGIADVRTDNRIDYISGDLGAGRVEEKAWASDHHIGFCIYPVQFDELVKVSDAKGTLPPKSTWFEPRMINGLVVKSY